VKAEGSLFGCLPASRSPAQKKPPTGQAAEYAVPPKEGLALEGILLAYLRDYRVSSTIDRLSRPFTNMIAYTTKDTTGTGAARIQDQDEMSNKTSVVSSAEGPPIQEEANKITAATYNPNLAETREVVIKYNKEFDENSGGGTI
jgi:hypothetical protein